MRRGYFTPPVLIILAIIIFAVAIVIAINTDLVKRLKNEASPTPVSSPTTQQPSPTPDETADWVIYKDEVLRFSLKHPKSWIVDPANSSDEYTIITNYDPSDPSLGRAYIEALDKGKLKIDISKDNKNTSISLEQYITNLYADNDPSLPTLISRLPTIIDNKPAIIVEWGQFNYIFATAYVEKDSSTIFSMAAGNDYMGTKKFFDQILSTFQFTD